MDVMNNFILSLSVMWKGMLGIFVVLGVIMIAVILLNRLTGREDSK